VEKRLFGEPIDSPERLDTEGGRQNEPTDGLKLYESAPYGDAI
jgi:hypothetical protein